LQIAFSKIVQKEADQLSRELKPTEIIRLFEDAYHFRSNPRFELIDYDISADRSTLTAPQGQAQSSKNLQRIFKGIVAVDGQEHHLVGVGNGAISSLANALKSLGINLDVIDYTEHAIGEGKDVKAATYIECTTVEHTVGSNDPRKVWGVGIHEDVVLASLTALLSAASSVGPLGSHSIMENPMLMFSVPVLKTKHTGSIKSERIRHSELDVSGLAKTTLLKATRLLWPKMKWQLLYGSS
jgi:2-isopropylmalate synthase